MNSQFGLVNVWTQGDIVTRSVALLLLAMSLASWMVIIIKLLDLRRSARHAAQTEAFWHSPDFAKAWPNWATTPATPSCAWRWTGAKPRPTTATGTAATARHAGCQRLGHTLAQQLHR
jgi:hypothetical protein